MSRALPLAGLAAVLLAAACSSSTTTTTTDTGTTVAPENTATPSDLRERSREFMASWNQDDPTVIAAFYTSGAVVTQGDSTWSGSDRIRTGFLANLSGLADLSVSEQTFTGRNDDYVERGSYRFTATQDGRSQTVTGKYETLWRREGGRWMITGMRISQDR